jgi:phage baseplate assembly protein gpV
MRNSDADIIADLYHRVAELERRVAHKKLTGKVTDVDGERGRVRIDLGRDDDGNVVKSGWMPVQELAAGSLKTSFLPTVGEQVDAVSETGDMTDAYASMSLPSKDNPRPHNKPGEGVFERGPMRIEMTEDRIILKVGSAKVTIRDGKIVLEASEVHLGGEGGKLLHRKGDRDSRGDVAVESATKVFAI